MYSTVRKEILKYCREGNTIMLDNALDRLSRPGMRWTILKFDRSSISMRVYIAHDIECDVTLRLFRKTIITGGDGTSTIENYISYLLESSPGFHYDRCNIRQLISNGVAI